MLVNAQAWKRSIIFRSYFSHPWPKKLLGEMLDCNMVVTTALEKDNQRLPELPHLFTHYSSWAHTSSPFKGLFP